MTDRAIYEKLNELEHRLVQIIDILTSRPVTIDASGIVPDKSVPGPGKLTFTTNMPGQPLPHVKLWTSTKEEDKAEAMEAEELRLDMERSLKRLRSAFGYKR